jgi:hypothetical protein
VALRLFAAFNFFRYNYADALADQLMAQQDKSCPGQVPVPNFIPAAALSSCKSVQDYTILNQSAGKDVYIANTVVRDRVQSQCTSFLSAENMPVVFFGLFVLTACIVTAFVAFKVCTTFHTQTSD